VKEPRADPSVKMMRQDISAGINPANRHLIKGNSVIVVAP
jgi:hypothetical protein